MNPIRLAKQAARLSRLTGVLDDAAKRPHLYTDARWRLRLKVATRELVDVVPMAPSLRSIAVGMLTNWKTTVAGLGSGLGYLFFSGLHAGMTPKDAIIAAALGLLGLLAKDHNVTGGTVPNAQ